jgi:hypothetical protein
MEMNDNTILISDSGSPTFRLGESPVSVISGLGQLRLAEEASVTVGVPS